MKISILMPTYNDSESIVETLESIVEQTYENYEIIIIDDGSTDSTKETIKSFFEECNKKIDYKYIYQNNSDQLNALKNASKYITGNYVYILHSDDLLCSKDTFKMMIDYVSKHKELDGIIADLILINSDSVITGRQVVKNYKIEKTIIPLQLLFLGRNLFVDFVFIKKQVFLENVYENYLTWNGPFWLNASIPSMLNIKKVDFPFLKYRVFSGNYINNEIGLLNVTNGEIRLVLNLMQHYNIPAYKIQYYMFRLFSKLGLAYKPLYQKKETRNKYSILKFVYSKRFENNDYKKYVYFSSILDFFRNYKKRTINIDNLPKAIYLGCDMRLFNKKMINNDLEDFYTNFFDEMRIGFDSVLVLDNKMKEEFTNIAKFIGIYPYIKIKVKENK